MVSVWHFLMVPGASSCEEKVSFFFNLSRLGGSSSIEFCFLYSMSILGLIFHHSTGAKCGSRGILAGTFSLGRECKGNKKAIQPLSISRRLLVVSRGCHIL